MSSEKELTAEESYVLLDRLGVGVISLVDPDGYPYAVPVNYIRLDDKVYIHGKKKGTKVDCIASCGRCCLVAFDEKGFEDCGSNACDTTVVYESVIVRGPISAVDDDARKMEILRALTDKLAPGKKDCPVAPERVRPTGVFEISIESITGKHHVPKAGNKVMKP